MNKKAHFEALRFFGFNLIANAVPYLILAFLLYVAGNRISVNDMTKNGEFAIMSIPLAIAACYTLYYYKSKEGFRFVDLVFWIYILITIFAAVLYAWILANPNKSNDTHSRIVLISYAYMTLVFIGLYISKFTEENNKNPLPESRKSDEQELEKNFDKELNKN